MKSKDINWNHQRELESRWADEPCKKNIHFQDEYYSNEEWSPKDEADRLKSCGILFFEKRKDSYFYQLKDSTVSAGFTRFNNEVYNTISEAQ